MTELEVKNEIKQIGDEIGRRLKSLEDGREAENQTYKGIWDDLKSAIAEAKSIAEKTAQRADQLEKLGASQEKSESFAMALKKALDAEKDRLAQYAKSRQRFSFTKSVGDMSTATNLTGQIAEAERRPGVSAQPYRVHARNILPVASSSLPLTEFVRHTFGEGVPDYQAEGAIKAQTDNDFALVTVNNYTLAHWERLPAQWLEDYASIYAFIQNNMIERLLNREDSELLFGGGGSAIQGLFAGASGFAPGVTVPNPQRFDVLRLAIAQLQQTSINGGGFMPDFCLVSPMTFAELQLTKNQDGDYILPSFLSEAGGSVSGVRIVPHRAMPNDGFLMGDSMQCLLQIYSPITLDISNEDRDNFVRNLVTVRVEERIKFPIFQPQAFLYSDFQEAIATITPGI